jgi:hypothetical protein
MTPQRKIKSVAITIPTLLSMFVASIGAPSSAMAVELSPSSTPAFESHFYRIVKNVYTLPTRSSWVTAQTNETVLILGQDSEFGDKSMLLGGTNLTYPLYSMNLSTRDLLTLGPIDFSPVVGDGARMRITDFDYFPEAQNTKGATTALVTFATFNPKTGCRTLIVQDVRISPNQSEPSSLGKTWYRMPCLSVTNYVQGTPGDPEDRQILHQSGGRLALAPKSDWKTKTEPSLYLSTGDFAVLAIRQRQIPKKVRDVMSSILLINSQGLQSQIASGIRNPQGLVNAKLDGKSQLIATSHGPRGGDELIAVTEGANYGWPKNSYGTSYQGKPTERENNPVNAGTKLQSQAPLFAWIPSIGISEIVQVSGSTYQQWWRDRSKISNRDFIVAGMASMSLYRVRVAAGAVRYVEAIPIQDRVRSMTQTKSGKLVAANDAGQLLVFEPAATWSEQIADFR